MLAEMGSSGRHLQLVAERNIGGYSTELNKVPSGETYTFFPCDNLSQSLYQHLVTGLISICTRYARKKNEPGLNISIY